MQKLSRRNWLRKTGSVVAGSLALPALAFELDAPVVHTLEFLKGKWTLTITQALAADDTTFMFSDFSAVSRSLPAVLHWEQTLRYYDVEANTTNEATQCRS